MAQAQNVPGNRAQISMSFAPVVKQVTPAVVSIYAGRIVNTRVSPFANDPFFQQFFGDEGGFGVPRRRMESALGSGVIVKSDGWIVTNRHVVAEADEIKVVLADKREYPAEVKLVDTRSDLAVLKINATALPTVPLGNSDTIEVGDLVLAIGNPFGVGQTVTSGIVSATARTAVGITDYGYFIQTDAAINPGNSGGALVDMTGQLVGINTAIYSRSGGSLGIGFAIPVNLVRTVIEAGATGQAPRRPWLGLTVQALTADLAESLGLDRPAGVIVKSIHPQSPVYIAGLRTGDVIVRVNDHVVNAEEELKFRVATATLGSEIQLEYIRDGKLGQLSCKLQTAPDFPPRNPAIIKGRNPFAGAQMANINPAVAEEMDLPPDTNTGVVVLRVSGRSPAGAVGLQAGDIILAINRVEVTSVEVLQNLLNQSQGRWQLRLRRGDQIITTTLRG